MPLPIRLRDGLAADAELHSMAGFAVVLPRLLTSPLLNIPGLTSPVLSSAAVAYAHSLGFMVCFAALVLERRLIRANPQRQEATLLVITDVVYGVASLTVLLSGILRVLYFGKESSFYTENPLFWWKVGSFVAVGTLSLYPTLLFILWAIPLRKGELPQVSEALAGRLRWILTIELVGFAIIPLQAALMARGVGLAN
jgi:putative membrane protein